MPKSTKQQQYSNNKTPLYNDEYINDDDIDEYINNIDEYINDDDIDEYINNIDEYINDNNKKQIH